MAHRFITDFKKFIEYGADDVEYDDVFTLCLDSAETFIENYCNIKLEQDTVSFTINGNGETFIHVPAAPLSSITEIVIDGVSDTVLDNYYIDGNFIKLKSGVLSTGVQNITVTYIVGWIDAQVPPPVMTTMFRIADKIYKDTTQNRDGVSGYDSQTKIGVDFIPSDLPEGTKLFLQPYVNYKV